LNTDSIISTASPSGSCRYTLEIQVPAQEVNTVFKDVVKTFTSKANIPGFRPGKIPHNLIKIRYAELIKDEVKQQVIQTSLERAIQDCDVKPLTSPVFVDNKVDDVQENNDFLFKVEFDVPPTFTLPDYKCIKLVSKKSEITEEDIDSKIDLMLKSQVAYKKNDTPASDEDMLMVSYTVEGVNLDDIPESAANLLKTDETWVVLKEPEVIPGIIAGLKGASAKDQVSLEITYSEDFCEGYLAGKKFNYSFTVHEVHSRVFPDQDDDFAKTIGCNDLNHLRSIVKQQLSDEQAGLNALDMQRQVRDFLLKETGAFPLPEQLLDMEKKYTFSSMQLKIQSMRNDAFEEFKDKTEDEIREMTDKEASIRLRLIYIVSEIAKSENINVSDEEVNFQFSADKEQYESYAKKNNVRFSEEELKSTIMSNLLVSKVYTRVIEIAAGQSV